LISKSKENRNSSKNCFRNNHRVQLLLSLWRGNHARASWTRTTRLSTQVRVNLVDLGAQAHVSPDHAVRLRVSTRSHVCTQSTGPWTIDRHWHQVVRVGERAET